MKPTRIILVRHGESEGNVSTAIYNEKPDYALLLSKKGKEQAQEAGHQLKNLIKTESVFFYVSPLWRTRMTFEEMASCFDKTQYWYREEPRLREQEWGHLRTVEECEKIDLERNEFGIFYYRVPDGESAADVYDRVSDFFGTLYRDFEKPDYPQNACMIIHGMTIRLFLMRWFHWTVEEFEILANPHNCEIVILEKNENNTYELVTEMKRKGIIPTRQRPIKLLPHN